MCTWESSSDEHPRKLPRDREVSQPGPIGLLSKPTGQGGGRTHLQVGHGHLIFHVVAGLVNGTEEVIEGPNVDAGLVVCAQHGVGFPAAWGRAGRRVSRGSWQTWVCPQGGTLPDGQGGGGKGRRWHPWLAMGLWVQSALGEGGFNQPRPRTLLRLGLD